MHSTWFVVTQFMFDQAQALAATRGVGWAANPPLPLDNAKQPGNQLLFVMPRGDVVAKGSNARQEERRMRLMVGVKALTADALSDADLLHFAARDLIKSPAFRVALAAATGGVGQIREVELEPELKDVAAEGSVLMSAYEIDYYQSYPSLA